MKLTITAIFTFGSGRNVVNGFSQVSFVPTGIKRTSLAASSGDPYGSLLDKLYESTDTTLQLTSVSSPPVISATATSSPPVVVTANLESGIADTQLMFHDALSLTIDAANKAASASAEVSKLSSQFRTTGASLYSSLSNNAVISDMMADAQAKLTELEPDVSKLSMQFRPGNTETVSNAMAAAQSKLAVLEQQLNDIKASSPASDIDLNQISVSLNDALDTSFRATEEAAKSSLAVLTSSVDTEAIAKILSDTQTKLYELEQVRTAQPMSHDIDLSQLYAALNEALDISSNAADHAAAASTIVVDGLVHLNLAIGHSMTGIDLGTAIPPEIADLLHKQMDVLANQAAQNHDAVVQSFTNAANLEYEKLSSSLEGAFSPEVSAFVAVYGLLAFMAGYSQNLGEYGYESEFRKMMEGAKFNVDEVGYDGSSAQEIITSTSAVESNTFVPVMAAETVPHQDTSTVDYDAAARLAYLESGLKVDFRVFKSLYLAEASAMVAAKNPYVKVNEVTSVSEPFTLKQGVLLSTEILSGDVKILQSKIEKAKQAISKEVPVFGAANM